MMCGMTDPITRLAEAHQQIGELPDAADRFIALTELLESVPGIHAQLRAERQETVLTMRAAGMSDVEIGERVGKHWARISAIARGVSSGGSDKKRKQPAPPREPTSETS